ncbi:hypothetical protein JRC16_24550, partial [Escherichia coli]|nr:hypothetical protein [Escherichia coli]
LKNWHHDVSRHGRTITGWDEDKGGLRTFYREDITRYLEISTRRISRCQRQDYWPFFAIFNVRYWSLMLSAFRHFIITDWRGVFCQH